MSRLLYSLGWLLATPLVIGYLLWRSRLQPEYRAHWAERWAFAPVARPAGKLIWVHAVSVGETRAAQPLIAAMLAQDPSLSILLTHMTPTGRQTGDELFVRKHADRMMQAYLPYDTPGAMRRFLRAWRPDVGIILETELWPNLCAQAVRLGVPLAMVNARLSERSLRKGLRWRRLITPAMRSLSLVIAQTEGDAARIRQLGRDAVQIAGNLKFDVMLSPELLERGRRWRERAGARPVLLAASTRDGEEALLLDTWLAQPRVTGVETSPAPLLLIVPRHPQRFDEVAREIEARGLRLARRSELDAQTESLAQAEVLLGDSMGEMPAYYGMADAAIIGGSLLPFGGQNLIEACAAGVPVVLGSHTYNFADAAEQAIEAGAAIRVADAAQAIHASRALLADASRCAQMSGRAADFARAHQGATQRTLALLAPLLQD